MIREINPRRITHLESVQNCETGEKYNLLDVYHESETYYAKVSAEDNWPKDYRWNLSDGYAYRSEGKERIFLHNEIVKRQGKKIPEEYQVDHINQNRLDNRRNNLRIVTRSENMKNRDLELNKLFPEDNSDMNQPAREKTPVEIFMEEQLLMEEFRNSRTEWLRSIQMAGMNIFPWFR